MKAPAGDSSKALKTEYRETEKKSNPERYNRLKKTRIMRSEVPVGAGCYPGDGQSAATPQHRNERRHSYPLSAGMLEHPIAVASAWVRKALLRPNGIRGVAPELAPTA